MIQFFEQKSRTTLDAGRSIDFGPKCRSVSPLGPKITGHVVYQCSPSVLFTLPGPPLTVSNPHLAASNDPAAANEIFPSASRLLIQISNE